MYIKETIIKIRKSPIKSKKYLAYIKGEKGKIRKLHFGSHDYAQWKDQTKYHIYKKWDHHDPKRRKDYYMRHSGVPTKTQALKKEIKKSKGLYTSKILSHIFLW